MITHLAKHDLNCTCSFDFFYPTRGPKFTIIWARVSILSFLLSANYFEFSSKKLSRGSVDATLDDKIINFKNEETVAGKKIKYSSFFTFSFTQTENVRFYSMIRLVILNRFLSYLQNCSFRQLSWSCWVRFSIIYHNLYSRRSWNMQQKYK